MKGIVKSCVGMSSASAPEVRPLPDRARDYAVAAGVCGGLAGACGAARHGAPVLVGGFHTAMQCGAISAAFIGLRALLLQDRWEEDREGVSGLAAGIIGGGTTALRHGSRAGIIVGAGSFAAGASLHYLHRWWLHTRVAWNM